MPRHRRRKNQRVLDSKSIRNSKSKNTRLKQEDESTSEERDDLDTESGDYDQDYDQHSDDYREAAQTSNTEGCVNTSSTLITHRDNCDDELETIGAVVDDLPGTGPSETHTPPSTDAASDSNCLQHQPLQISDKSSAVSNSNIDDREPPSEYLLDKRAKDELTKTGSNQSTAGASEPLPKDDESHTEQPATASDVETEFANVSENIESGMTQTAPCSDVNISRSCSTIKELSSQSDSFAESLDTLKDDRVGAEVGRTSESENTSSHLVLASPENHISNNQNETTCDITTTTAPEAATASEVKASNVNSNLPICDKANDVSQNALDDPSSLQTQVQLTEIPAEVSLNESDLTAPSVGLETIVCNHANEKNRSLSQVASEVSGKIVELCNQIVSEAKTNSDDLLRSSHALTSSSQVSDSESAAEMIPNEPTFTDVNQNILDTKCEQISDTNQVNIPDLAGNIQDSSSIPPENSTTPTNFTISTSCSSDSITDEMSSFDVNSPLTTPIRHPIIQEVIATLYPTRVESPKPLRPKRTGPLGKSKSLDDDDIMIQEMSDTSSTSDLTDNQPLISEASESEADTDITPVEFEEKPDPRILSIQTLPLESSLEENTQNDATGASTSNAVPPEDAPGVLVTGETPDPKVRRARNRAALEMHFFPQFLNPRYLDSIKEENSDTSDLESKSPTRGRSTSSLTDLEDDVFAAAASSTKRRSSAPSTPTTPTTPKADAVFPKSNLDFSQKRKHLSNLRSPQASVIREESPCYVVETKIIEPPTAVEERCSDWTTQVIPASSEAAELVYIDSASSSSSDLRDPDYIDVAIPSDINEDDSSESVEIGTPTIEANDDAKNVFRDPEKTPTREIPESTEQLSQPNSNYSVENASNETSKTEILMKNFNDIEHHNLVESECKISSSQDAFCKHAELPNTSSSQPHVIDFQAHAKTASDTSATPANLIESFHTNHTILTSLPQSSEERLPCSNDAGQSAVEHEPPVTSSSAIEIQCEQKQQISIVKPDFHIGEPCSSNMFAKLCNTLVGSNNSEKPSLPITEAVEVKPVDSDLNNTRGELVRQDSSGSHGSAHSQNTVIDRGPSSQCDFADIDIGPCVSGTSNEFEENAAKTLRELCLERIVRMPYGEKVLEELAIVSESITNLTDRYQKRQEDIVKSLENNNEMPYPRPELPEINELIIPQRPNLPEHVKLTMIQSLKSTSPPPPPVPDRPKTVESWLGVPTDKDPNVLVCLSPAQRQYMNDRAQKQKYRIEPTPDALLDMHQKFIERRGYHELPSQLVEEIDRGKTFTENLDRVVSSTQLRKSTSPPPIPPPPVADTLRNFTEKHTDTATSAQSDSVPRHQVRVSDDDPGAQNNHRLLTIIRDSQQSLDSDKQTSKVEHRKAVTESTNLSTFHTTESASTASQENTQHLPPEVPSRPSTATSETHTHGTAPSTPKSADASEMSSTTSTSFSSPAWGDPFDFNTSDSWKRFSNIETKSPFCSQLMRGQPKRYSNIETTTVSSKKCIENGNVLYDVSDKSKEKVTSGDEELAKTISSDANNTRGQFVNDFMNKTAATFTQNHATPAARQSANDAVKSEQKTFNQQQQQDEQKQSTRTFSQMFENRPASGEVKSRTADVKNDRFAYDEFRQRAKESATERAKSEFLERQNFLLKDFDELTKLIKDDLFSSGIESKSSKTSHASSTTTAEEKRETVQNNRFDGSARQFADPSVLASSTGSCSDRNESREYKIPIKIEGSNSSTKEHVETKFENKEHRVYNVPIVMEQTSHRNHDLLKTRIDQNNRTVKTEANKQAAPTQTEAPKMRTVPIQLETPREAAPPTVPPPPQMFYDQTDSKAKTTTQGQNTQQEAPKIHRIPIQIEMPRKPAEPGQFASQSSSNSQYQRQQHFTERRLSSQNLEEWMRYVGNLGSTENITKPIQKEVELCAFGRKSNIRAPRIADPLDISASSRLSQSTSNLATAADNSFRSSHQFARHNSMVDTTPIFPVFGTEFKRQMSVPREMMSNNTAEIFRQKEAQLREEFDKLENDRRRIIEEMDRIHQKNRLRRDVFFHQSCRLPTLSEEESFRQQMHDEWLNKVAEREERRMHKIVKISGTPSDLQAPEAPQRNMTKAASTTNISDEFLKRVKERRTKLAMPSDSDWDSGAESQPTPRAEKEKTPPQVKVIEGQSERDYRNLPPHLREFAEITNKIIEEHYHEEERTTSTTSNQTTTNNIKTSNETATKKEDTKTSHRIASTTTSSTKKADPKKPTTILRSDKSASKIAKTPGNRKKETRFKLAHDRRSWSESDLLKEIDNALTISKGFIYSQGVWSPNNYADSSSAASHSSATRNGPPPPPPPPVWSPQPSPTPARKGFRPVKFESPVLQRKFTGRQDSAPVTPPWSDPNSKPLYNTQSSSCSNIASDNHYYQRAQQSQYPQQTLRKSESVGANLAPRPSGASYTETNRPQIPKDKKPAFVRPNEVIYQVKNEYMSEPETENDRPKKMAQLARRKFDGIGPTTRDGMPIVLRSEVKENNQHQWYKRMYNTLHKAKNDGRYPYRSNGYMSEPEPNYDSDYSTMKYHTLDRRRIPSTGSYQDDRTYGTMPNPVRSNTESYKNQPGRIENYIPGHSSVSDKEKKEWWDEVMDIFDGRLEQQKLSSNYTEGYLSRALKEDGYASDSNLIFHKQEEPQVAPLSPVEQKQVYRSVQAGGEPPLQGFRKPAPEKPKDDGQIEYYPITPTLTKIRVHSNANDQPPIQSHQQIVCYPITNVTRPLDLFAPFPKNVPSFIPLNPPAPPCRKSSRSSASVKVVASHYSSPSPGRKTVKPVDIRHQACFQSDYYQNETPTNKFGTITIKRRTKHEPLVRSKSAGAVSSSSRLSTVVHEDRTPGGSTRVSRRQLVHVRSVSPGRIAARSTDLRKSSPSPVAFGRSISKERMFAEEKKRLEQTLPLTRRSFTASTNILKDPSLKSAEEVKKAVRSSYTSTKPTSSRTASFFGTVTRRNITPSKQEEKSMRIAVSSSSKAHESRRNATKAPSTSKTTFHSSKHFETKTPKQTTKASSTLSLARTSSTFSVDSTGSRRKDSRRPQTITRSVSKDAPRTISSHVKSKRKSPPKEIVATSKVHKQIETTAYDSRKVKAELKKEINKSIVQHHDSIRSDSFFQNLFLRDVLPEISLPESAVQLQTSVLDKTHFWNTLSARSEPSLRRSSVYLSQKRPVSDSKFLTMESKHIHKSRSLSPSYRRRSPTSRILGHISKFNSIYQMSEEESEFGEQRPSKTEELIYKYEQRSSSEPRSRTYLTEVIRPNLPTVIHGHHTVEYSRSMSPITREIVRPPTREVRSPSRRKIDSFRESHRAETKRVIRASSLSSADDRSRRRLYTTSELSHSTGSLNVIEKHAPICRHRMSDRFRELNRFYRNLERIGQLERATSSTDLHPIRKEGELIDFDVWKKVRDHEKAEKELNHLVGKLKQDQREKDLFFRPKDALDVKWSKKSDSGLRCKEKSVEDLKEAFERKAQYDELEEARQAEIECTKDTYKPHWRGSSVVDVASNMVVKYNPQTKARTHKRDDPRLFISNNLISTLSKEQVSKLKNQLSEIYSASPGPSPKSKCEVKEDYVITVDKPTSSRPGSLKVRCNSSISKEELLEPVLRKKEAQIRAMKSKSIDRQMSPPRPPAQSRTFEKIAREVSSYQAPGLSEIEKKRLSLTISREIQDKVLERKSRNVSPSLLARETRGAVAAENAKKTLPDPTAPKEFLSVEYSEQKLESSRDSSLEKRTSVRVRRSSAGESESNTSDISKATVIYKGQKTDGVIPKIKYFEEKKSEEPPKTIYHAREYSSPDEEEVLKAIEEKMKAREKRTQELQQHRHSELSSSVSDFKELFGERSSNFQVPPPPPPPDESRKSRLRVSEQTQFRVSPVSLSNGSSFETIYRSRSASPAVRHYTRTYLNAVRTGDVRKITDKFETMSAPPCRNFFELGPPRRIRSDPDLSKHVFKEGKSNVHKVTVRDHESGDVSWIAHKFEMKNNATRGRSRVRKIISPIPRNPLRKEDRLMPHIDIISKTALLKQEMIKSKSPSRTVAREYVHSGEVERIRSKFESPERTSLLGQMFTSSPDISELKDISSYLSASWIAHKYPKKRDNARSPICPEQGPESIEVKRRAIAVRPSSTSPPRTKSLVTSILKPYYDIFANQKFDPLMHRPIARYAPDDKVDYAGTRSRSGWKKSMTSTVKFEENDVVIPPTPPPPPIKNVSLNNNNYENGLNYCPESPRRYVEGDVNIHYKSPIRYEYKDAIPEEELARKQAESMRKLFNEERRRKYIQELEDMQNRRHTDHFIPSQKSPISLNRYDDFPTDISPKSPLTANFTRTVARALYNFQGQTARELSFKKGDVIYIRKQIDKNWYEGEHNAMVGLLPVNYVEIITKDGSRPAPPKKPSEGQARAKFNFQAQSSFELSLNKGELVTLTQRVDANWFEGKIGNRKGIFPVSYVEVLTDIGAEDAKRSNGGFNNNNIITSKPIGAPASRSLITTNHASPSLDQLRTTLNNEFNHLTNGGQHPNGILRETKTSQKTEILHVDTNTEPMAYRVLYKYVPQNNDELELFEGDIVYVLEKCDDGWYVGTSQRTNQFGTFPGNYVERATDRHGAM